MDKVATSLSLMRRLPPNKIEQNLSGLINLLPDETDELLQRIDQPLTEETDVDTGRRYLLCDYNRDGDSYRSPWSNKYKPALDDGFVPSEKLRLMEIEANELFDAYRELYFEGGTSSVYLWDLDMGFAGCFLIKKTVEGTESVKEGSWDSIHIVEAQENKIPGKTTYKLTTTCMVHMGVEKPEVGKTSLSGSLTRQTELTTVVNENRPHLANIGRLIEDMEYDMRSNLNELYVLKTREIINSLHRSGDGPVQKQSFVADLNAAVMGHGVKNLSLSHGA